MQIYKNYPDDKAFEKIGNLNAVIEQEGMYAEELEELEMDGSDDEMV
jgi:hypothetical protein